ncbi:unnamed protein product [Rotaria magnacalcarata]
MVERLAQQRYRQAIGSETLSITFNIKLLFFYLELLDQFIQYLCFSTYLFGMRDLQFYWTSLLLRKLIKINIQL